MIAIGAFPLSLHILLRLFLILPKWILAYAVIITFATAATLTLLQDLPVIGLLAFVLFPVFAVCVMWALTIHPYLLGIRAGLDLLDEPIEDEDWPLLRAAIFIGAIEGFVALCIVGVVLVGYHFVADGAIRIDLFGSTAATADPSSLAVDVMGDITLGATALAVGLVAVMRLAFRAALLPVMSMAAAGRPPRQKGEGFRALFGSHFIGLFGLLVITTGMAYHSLSLLLPGFGHSGFVTFLLDGLRDLAQSSLSSGALALGWALAQWMMFLMGGLIALWVFALQCAGAAIAFQSSNGAPPPKSAETREQEVLDIRALRHGRM